MFIYSFIAPQTDCLNHSVINSNAQICVSIPPPCVDRTWECFVKSVEPAHLGPLLSHVIVALLPLVPLQPKETAAIIRFLILDNR